MVVAGIVKLTGCNPISILSVYVPLAAVSFTPEVQCLLVRRFASHFIEDFETSQLAY
jgi:hypothetical protein